MFIKYLQAGCYNKPFRKSEIPIEIVCRCTLPAAARHESLRREISGDPMKVPLEDLVCNGEYEMLQSQLRRGVPPDRIMKSLNGKTPLFYAAQVGDVKAAYTLLKYHANPNTVCQQGFTPLLIAVESGCTLLVKTLIEYESDVNASILERDTGRSYSILDVAVARNDMDMVELLLWHGATVYKPNLQGRTCLHIAAALGHYDMVDFLLLKKLAMFNLRDSNGDTPLALAVRGKHYDVADLIVERRGDFYSMSD